MREQKTLRKGEKCVKYMGSPRNFPSGTVSVLLVKTRNVVESQVVQWIDGTDKTRSDGFQSEDLGGKSGREKSVAKIRAPWLDVQELELEQQPTSQELLQETQEALPDPEEET